VNLTRSNRALRRVAELFAAITLIAIVLYPPTSRGGLLLLAGLIAGFFILLMFLRRWPSI